MIDIQAIDDRISTLEDSATSTEDVVELGSLYIIKQNTKLTDTGVVADELDDIIPHYKQYCNIKRRYQMDEVTETAVCKSLKNICKEVEEFINTLYSHTDMARERRCISELIERLYSKYRD